MECNKVAVITGGGSGLGLASAELLLSKGYKVAVWDLKCAPNSSNVLFCEVNVTDSASISSALEKTLKAYLKIDLLLNCAGIAIAALTISKSGVHSMDIFNKIIQVNLIGLFDVCRQVSKTMRGGVIINVASVAGFEGPRGMCAYSSSKSAILGLTLPMARELARFDIRVVCICPSLFDTPMKQLNRKEVNEIMKEAVLLKRIGEAHEFAHAVYFVAENQYVNGSTIKLDGGTIGPYI